MHRSQALQVVNVYPKTFKDFLHVVVPEISKRALVMEQKAESTDRVSSRSVIDEGFDSVFDLDKLVFYRGRLSLSFKSSFLMSVQPQQNVENPAKRFHEAF